MRTGAGGVWAIGDVIGGILLAHVGSYEGVWAVENVYCCDAGDDTPLGVEMVGAHHRRHASWTLRTGSLV